MQKQRKKQRKSFQYVWCEISHVRHGRNFLQQQKTKIGVKSNRKGKEHLLRSNLIVSSKSAKLAS